MLPETRKFLYDASLACKLLQQFTHIRTLDDYRTDPLLRSPVERHFIIVSEALAGALRIEPAIKDSITNARRIISFRNILVHGYSAVEHETVWGKIENHLPLLPCEIDVLLQERNDQP
jgi:uncharacterized protein with HEPN domain